MGTGTSVGDDGVGSPADSLRARRFACTMDNADGAGTSSRVGSTVSPMGDVGAGISVGTGTSVGEDGAGGLAEPSTLPCIWSTAPGVGSSGTCLCRRSYAGDDGAGDVGAGMSSSRSCGCSGDVGAGISVGTGTSVGDDGALGPRGRVGANLVGDAGNGETSISSNTSGEEAGTSVGTATSVGEDGALRGADIVGNWGWATC